MILEKSNSSLSKLINIEYIGLGFGIFLTALLFTRIGDLGNDTAMIISYTLTMVSFIRLLGWSWYKIKHLLRINLASDTILDTKKSMERFRLMISREKLFAIIFTPILAMALYTLRLRWLHHKNVMDALYANIFTVIVAYVCALTIALLVYGRFYLQNIKSIVKNLEEIESFGSK